MLLSIPKGYGILFSNYNFSVWSYFTIHVKDYIISETLSIRRSISGKWHWINVGTSGFPWSYNFPFTLVCSSKGLLFKDFSVGKVSVLNSYYEIITNGTLGKEYIFRYFEMIKKFWFLAPSSDAWVAVAFTGCMLLLRFPTMIISIQKWNGFINLWFKDKKTHAKSTIISIKRKNLTQNWNLKPSSTWDYFSKF